MEKNLLKIFRLLSKNFHSKEEILKLCNIKESSFYKYLSDFQKNGFEIIKSEQKYKIKNYSNLINLKEKDISGASYLSCLSYFYLTKQKNKNIDLIFENIFSFSNKDNYEKYLQKQQNYMQFCARKKDEALVSVISKYLKKNDSLTLITGNKEILTVFPVSLILNKENKRNKKELILNFIDKNNEYKKIPVKNILKIKKENNLLLNSQKENIIFEVYGRLKDTYSLKENERIIDFDDEKIVVLSKENNEYKLFKRLLKYDSNCKILYPKEKIEHFKKIIKKSLDNIMNI